MTALSPSSAQAAQSITDTLLPGEQVRWAGRPRRAAQWRAFAIWLFAVPWTAFALFWENTALLVFFAAPDGQDAGFPPGFGIVFPLFGLPFVLVGLAMLASPFRSLSKASHTVHAVTDRRLLTVVTGRTREVKSAFVDRIGPVERVSGKDGWGSIRVQTLSRIDSDGDRYTEQLAWIGIPDVAHVERLILEAQPGPAAR